MSLCCYIVFVLLLGLPSTIYSRWEMRSPNIGWMSADFAAQQGTLLGKAQQRTLSGKAQHGTHLGKAPQGNLLGWAAWNDEVGVQCGDSVVRCVKL